MFQLIVDAEGQPFLVQVGLQIRARGPGEDVPEGRLVLQDEGQVLVKID